MAGEKRYGVTKVTIRLSRSSSAQSQTGDNPVTTSNIIGIVLGLIAVLVIVLLAIYCTSSYRRPLAAYIPSLPALPSFLRRAPPDERKRGDLELSHAVLFSNSAFVEAGGAGGFDNPNYGQPQLRAPYAEAEGGSREMQPEIVFQMTKGGFSNPLYGDAPTFDTSGASRAGLPPPGVHFADFTSSYIPVSDKPPSMKDAIMGILSSRSKPTNNNEDDPPLESPPPKSEAKAAEKTDAQKSSKSGDSETKKSKKSKTAAAEIESEDSDGKVETSTPTDGAKKKKKSSAVEAGGKSTFGKKQKQLEEVDSNEEEKEENVERKKEGKKWRRGRKKGDVDGAEGGDLGFGNPLYFVEDLSGLPKAELKDEVALGTASGFANPLFQDKQTAGSADVSLRDVTADDSTI